MYQSRAPLPSQRLRDRRILVTGAGRGIGAAVADAYAAEGARVVGFDLSFGVGSSSDARFEQVVCDVSNPSSVAAEFRHVGERLGGLDVLVNAAGVERSSPAEQITPEDWDLMLDVNAKGTFLTNNAALGLMRQSGGHIVNFGSAAGMDPYPGGAHYSAAKGALMAWSRTVAREWGRFGVRVNVVVPSIWTPMYDEHRARMAVDELAEHDRMKAAQISLGGKQGDMENDLLPVMVFLATEDCRFITGQIIAVNGGFSMVR